MQIHQPPQGDTGGVSIAPLAGCIGATITGVDLSTPLAEPLRREIWEAMQTHKVIFFPGQRLDHAAHVNLARRFGPLTRRPAPNSGAAPEGFPEILTIDTQERDPRYGVDFEDHYRQRWLTYTDGWHTDLTPAVNPPAASILRAEQVTSFGGDTQWTNLEAAYEALSPSMQAMADGLRAEHAFFAGCQMRQHDAMDAEVLNSSNAHPLVSEHPVVRVHPETGRKALFVNPASTSRILGYTPAQSQSVLRLFFEQIIRAEFTVRWRWQAGDVAMWDNRATAHLGPADAGAADERRTMYRVTILGDVPVGPDGRCSTPVVGEPFLPLPEPTMGARS